MSAEKLKISSTEEFYELGEKAGETNAFVSQRTKELNQWKSALKEFMIENDIQNATAGEFTLTAFDTVRSSMDEEKMIAIINRLIDETDDEEVAEKLASCVEYKPQVNEDLVADLVYNNIIAEADLAEALISSTSVGLRFGKVKKPTKK